MVKVSLDGLLEGGKDLRGKMLPVRDAVHSGLAGHLTLSLVALSALTDIESEIDEASVTVELSALRLNKPPKLGTSAGAGLYVIVDMLGAGEARTDKKPTGKDGAVSLGYRQA